MTNHKKKFECTCDGCKRACTYKPGWFLPKEAEKAAEYLGLSLKEFFDKYLGVDWWKGKEDEEDIFVLAPALVGEETGSEYPGDPRGKCVFFNKDELCDIHPVKPFECAEFVCDGTKTKERHKVVAMAWKKHQNQIIGLLGHKPESKVFYGGLFGPF